MKKWSQLDWLTKIAYMTMYSIVGSFATAGAFAFGWMVYETRGIILIPFVVVFALLWAYDRMDRFG